MTIIIARRAAVFIALMACAAAAFAHEGHDHGEEEAAAPLEVRLDKAAQRHVGLRTITVNAAAMTVRLPARVVLDPRRELRVAATQAGVVEPVGKILPLPGQTFAAGEALAQLRPMLTQPERRDVGADLAEADRDVDFGRLQIERFNIDDTQQFDVKLPTPTLQILTDYRTALAKQKALRQGLQTPQPLTAPRAGTLLRSNVTAGRVVAEGETLFVLGVSGALSVEAEFIDDDLDAAAAVEAVTRTGRRLPLAFIGAGYDADTRTRRALYAIAAVEDAAGVTVNETLSVIAPHAASSSSTLTLPVGAAFRRDGATWVWLHAAPEQFTAAAVQVLANDGETLRVRGAWRDDDRIVTQGASALLLAAASERHAR